MFSLTISLADEIIEKIIKKILILTKCGHFINLTLVNKELHYFIKKIKIYDFIEEQLKIVKIFSIDTMSGAISNNGKVWIWGQFKNEVEGNKIYSNPVNIQSNLIIENIIFTSDFIILIDYDKNFIFNPKWKKIKFNNQFINCKSKSKHIIFLDKDGIVFTSGKNNYGQLGIFSQYNIKIPKKVEYLKEIKIKSINVSNNTSFCISDNGNVYSFGSNLYGELGIGLDTSKSYIPIKIENLSNIKEIYTGNHHIFAIDNHNKLFGWGYNNYNQLGLDSNDILYNINLIYLPHLINFKYGIILKIAASKYHSLFLTNNLKKKNKVYSCGYGYYGSLGHNNPKDYTLKNILELKKFNIIDISTGNNSSIVLSDSGIIFVFGNNSYFQLGIYKGIDKYFNENLSNCYNTYTPIPLKCLNSIKFKLL